MTLIGEISEYWCKRAESYSDMVNEDISNDTEYWLSVLNGYVSGGPLRILDIGTGPGFFPVILGKSHNITGIDCSEEMLSYAKENCKRYGSKADFRLMEAHHLDFDDSTFDLVISRNVTWNLEHPEKAYAEWLRVLKDGGGLLIFDSNHYLFLNDSEFRDAGGDRDTATHPCIRGVDPLIMREIARNLPMSFVRRPQWDVSRLTELGVRKVVIETDDDGCVLNREGEKIIQPFSFLIYAEKR